MGDVWSGCVEWMWVDVWKCVGVCMGVWVGVDGSGYGCVGGSVWVGVDGSVWV